MLTDAPRGAKPTADRRFSAGRPRPAGYVACGWHAAEAFLRARPAHVREVLAVRELPADLTDALRATGLDAKVVTTAELDRRVGGLAHQGILVAGEPPRPTPVEDLMAERASPLVVVDGVTDPRNVGAMFRSAEAAGAGGLALSRDHAPALTPALVKAAAGAVEWLRHARVVNVARLLGQLREAGYWVVGLDSAAEVSLWDPGAIPGAPLALVVGAEGRGLRSLVRRTCHRLVAIPMRGRTASLNVSVAAAVALFEATRRLGGGAPPGGVRPPGGPP